MENTAVNAQNIALLSSPAIVTLFNNLAESHSTNEVAQVKRFADRATAEKRTLALLDQCGMAIASVEAGVPTLVRAGAGEPTGEGNLIGENDAQDHGEPPVGRSDGSPAKKERKRRGFRFVFPKKDEIKTAREGSKRAQVVALLSRPEGATLAEIMTETGWDEKNAYEGTRLVHFYLGYGMKQDENGRVRLVK